MRAEHVLDRRRAWRDELVGQARAYVVDLGARVGLRAAVVIGSVARGDFNRWSDVDLLVIAEGLPERSLDRLAALEPRPGGIQPIPWTPEEWRKERARENPIAAEALLTGIWLHGSASALEG